MVKQKAKTAPPKLRFPEFRESSWGRIPGGGLFESISVRNSEAGLPILAITQAHGAIPRDLIDYHVAVTDKSIESYKVVERGDFIISLRSFQGGIEYSNYRGICSPAYVILRRTGDGSSQYFKHLFKSDRFIQQLTRNIEGLRDGKMISYKQFSEQSIPTPAPAEQQKIADCLTSLDEVIAAQGRKVEALKAHKRGLMQQLFPREGETRPRLRFPEFRNAPQWNKIRLGDVVEVASGQVNPTESPYRDMLHVGGANIEGETGSIFGLRSAREDGVISGKCLFNEGDILYSKIRPILNKVAAPGFRGICSADIYPIRPASTDVSRCFLLYLLRSASFVEYATEHSERGKIPKINREALLGYGARLPGAAEQQRIADCLASLDTRISAEADQLATLKTHKQGLMQQLFPAPEAMRV